MLHLAKTHRVSLQKYNR